MVVKIQRPLFTNEDIPLAMVYDEDRRFINLIPWNHELAKWFKDDGPASIDGLALKIYAIADVHDGKLVIQERVEDCDW